MSATAATAASRSSTTIWSSRPFTTRWARRGPSASRRARINISTVRIRTRTTITRQIMAVTGEIYKMELDGTILGKFGKPGKQLGEFGTVHEIDCRNENELLVSRDHSLAGAENQPASRRSRNGGRHENPRLALRRARCSRAEPSYDRRFSEAPRPHVSGRGRRGRHQIEGQRLRVHPDRGTNATAGARAFSRTAARGCSSSTATANTSARSGRASMASCSPNP